MNLITDEFVEKAARELARYSKVSSKKNKNSKAKKELADNYYTINSIYKKLLNSYTSGHDVIPASEWLLDNFYVIEEHAKELKKELKGKAYYNLPVMAEGKYKGYTRIYGIAQEIVKSQDGKIDEDLIELFLKNYENEQALYMREIWTLLIAIRIALIDKIAAISKKMYRTYLEWEKAIKWIKDYDEKIDLKLSISDMNVNSSFIEHLAFILRRSGKKGLIILNRIDSYIEKYGLSVDKVSHIEHARQAALKISMGNSILSLKYISNIDFSELFNKISVIENTFNNDPLDVYKNMDIESKHAYRARIEYIAKNLKISETHVAKKVLSLAKEAEPNTKESHIGYYLWNEGQEYLESKLVSYVPKIYKLKKEIRNEPFFLYVSSIFVVAIFITIAFFYFTKFFVTPTKAYYIGMILTFLVALDSAVCFINYSFNRIFKPRIIPRIDFKDGIIKSTMVIVPTLLSSVERVEDMLENIEKYFVATNDKNVYFTLVGDAKESNTENDIEDDKIAEVGLRKVAELNKKYNTKSFFFVYRKRFFNKTENKWLGYERKRGAIIKFNEFLLTKDASDYKAISEGFDTLPPILYVLTVDADTCIPQGAVQKLVGAISHPLNAPKLNEEGTAVIDGYGLIQPHIGIDVESANKSIFSKIFAGSGGIDPYVCASSDIYQDLFGEAIFTGKGIYDLNIFAKVLHNAIKENTVLSHDLLEGSYLRVGLSSDIELIDGYPYRYNSYAMRSERWVRGDWQIISWLFSKVRNANNEKVKNPINKISKWKIFDNLRRSLTAILILLGIILSTSVLPGYSLIWISFFLIAGIRGNKKQFLLQILFLPFTAYLILKAIIKTMFRMFVSHKNLLEWVTAKDMDTKLKNTVTSYYRLMGSPVLFGIVIILLSVFIKQDALSVFTSTFLGVLWILAPLVSFLISTEIKDNKEKLDEKELEKLKEYAKRTFNYFSTLMNEENNYLPPDNYQEDPPNEVASRTSPTNIGLGLMALVCGYDLKLIDENTLFYSMKNVLSTIDKLEKWNGHLLNWYNTKTLKPLFPRYISTVDSGNFLGYVITVKESLKKLNLQEEKKNALINRLKVLEDEIHFDVLYDNKKNVFSIGYNLEENRLTNSYYDLFASESRQTSFLAVARHEVPTKHWFSLSRNLTRFGREKGLISWTGTMFEYLMPILLMKNYSSTLLDETYNFVIKCQMEYAKKKRVPVWGISESAFYNFDINLNYQYKALGVPWLGLKRGLVEDTVISPYSTMLALMVNPKEAIKNLTELEKLSMLGEYGFYEAVDFTPRRLNLNNVNGYAIVKSYMAHHQGMSLVALNNVINDNIMQKRFHSSPVVKSIEYLLQEKIKKGVIFTKDTKEKVVPHKEVKVVNIDTARVIKDIDNSRPNVQILTNGNLYSMINDRGNGFMRYKNMDILRSRSDYILRNSGPIFYIKCINTGKVWTASYKPYLVKPDSYAVVFSGDKAKITRVDDKIETTQEVIVSAEDDVEVRKISITNNTDVELEFSVTSYMEVVLDNKNVDLSHRVFENMFIKTYCEDNMLFAVKKYRDNKISKAVFATSCVGDNKLGGFSFETDRRNFVGRYRSLVNPVAIMTEKPLAGNTGAVLEPILAQRRYIKLASGAVGQINFITGIADTKEDAKNLANKYLSENMISRTFRMAFARNQVELSYLNVTSDEVAVYDDLMKFLV